MAPRATTTQYGYNRLSRLSTESGGLWTTRGYEYDVVGSRTFVRDANGQAIQCEYDELNTLTRVHPSASDWTNPEGEPEATPSARSTTHFTG